MAEERQSIDEADSAEGALVLALACVLREFTDRAEDDERPEVKIALGLRTFLEELAASELTTDEYDRIEESLAVKIPDLFRTAFEAARFNDRA